MHTDYGMEAQDELAHPPDECSCCGKKIGPESIENWRTWVLFCLWERKKSPRCYTCNEGIETTV